VSTPDQHLIADIDRDGRMEVLVDFLPPFASPSPGKLACYETDGTRRWEVLHGREITFDGRSIRQDYVGLVIRSVTVDSKPFLLTVAGHKRWGFTQVALRDPLDGKAVEEFWHTGALTHCVLQDRDRDGTVEVVLAGVNNPGHGLGRAALMLLKLPFSRVPVRQESLLSSFSSGGPAAYVLFPRSDITTRLGVVAIIHHLWVEPLDTVHVIIRSAEGRGVLTYVFRGAWDSAEFHAAPDLAYVHDKLWEAGQLDHRLQSDEVRCLGQILSLNYVPDGNGAQFRDRWRDCELAAP
jgi:hypothetical protein